MSIRLYKLLWEITWTVLVRPLPRSTGSGWKSFLLRLFGARIGKGCDIYSNSTILIPSNLIVGNRVCIGPNTIIHNTAQIVIGSNSIVSQGSYLCTGTHDITSPLFTNIRKPIIIGDHAWVAAQCFIGPGVTIGDGAVCGARAVVFKDVEPWTVVCGNPAKFIKKREIKG